MSENIFCPNCGTEMSQYNRFCPSCGEEVGESSGTAQNDTRREPGEAERRPGDSRRGGTDGPGRQHEQGGTAQRQAQTAQTGHRDQRARGAEGHGQPPPGGAGPPGIARKDTFETVRQAFGWLQEFPALFGAFLVVSVFNSVTQLVVPGGVLLSFPLSVLVGGVAYVSVDAALQGNSLSLGDATDRVSGQVLSLVGASLLLGVATFFGFLLLVVPGIYIGLRLSLALPACAIDDYDAVDSLQLSWDIAQGNLLKLLGISLLSVAIAFAVAIPLSIVGLVAADATGSSLVFSLVTAPAGALSVALIQFSLARVYVENRRQGGPSQSPGAGPQY